MMENKSTDTLPRGRIAALDAFRGAVILLMILVNFLSGVSGLPFGIKHMPAGYDGMSVADVVFPCFLFIVGQSLPFAIRARRDKGDTPIRIQQHVLARSFALIVMGLFMVNAEEGFNEAAMGMSIRVWILLFFVAALMIWGTAHPTGRLATLGVRTAGWLMIVILAFKYHGGPQGDSWMATTWWGILGCIGWAQFLVSEWFLLTRGRLRWLLAGMLFCVLYFEWSQKWGWNEVVSMHVTHTSIMLAGLCTTQLFFNGGDTLNDRQRLLRTIGFALFLALLGLYAHQTSIISKIDATPPWAMFSAAIAVLWFGVTYWLVQARGWQGWALLIGPAAASPLMTYLIPQVVDNILGLTGLRWPVALMHGATGVGMAAMFAIAVLVTAAALNRFNIRFKI